MNPGNQKLSIEEVVEMRELCAAGWTQADIARKFRCTPSHVNGIVDGRRRRDAGGPLRVAHGGTEHRTKSGRRPKLTDEQRAQILAAAGGDLVHAEIAELVGCGPSQVRRFLSCDVNGRPRPVRKRHANSSQAGRAKHHCERPRRGRMPGDPDPVSGLPLCYCTKERKWWPG